MSISSAQVYQFRQAVHTLYTAGGDRSFINLTASAVNGSGNTEGVTAAALIDYTSEPGVSQLVFMDGATACAAMLYSVDGLGTASIAFYTAATACAGFSFQIGSSTADGDTCDVEIFNDFYRAYSWGEADVSRFVLAGDADYQYLVDQRTVRQLLQFALNSMLLTAFDMTRDSGESNKLSQRARAVRELIKQYNDDWQTRTGEQYMAPEDNDIVYDDSNVFDETTEGYDPLDEY